MPIQHITELFALDGRDFVTEAYRNLLQREPDEQGMRYYLGRLGLGYGKTSIILQLARSAECRPIEEMPGLKQFIADEKTENHWLWGWFSRRRRQEKLFREGIQGLTLIATRLDQFNGTQHVLPQRMDSLSEDLTHIATRLDQFNDTLRILPQRMGALSERLTDWKDLQTPPISNDNTTPKLSKDVVRAAFREILGREPENDDVIEHHANHENPQQLRTALMQSEEFRSKAGSEHAKLLLGRLCQTVQ